MKVFFLDRDGIINVSPPEGQYIESPEQLKILNSIIPAMQLILSKGFKIIVVTNQRCVNEGIINHKMLYRIHKKMLDELAVHNIKIEKIYYCPHGENQCECRKPKPGMILQACKDYNIDLVASYLLGDNHSDIEAANAAGIGNAILYLPKNKLNASVSKHKKIRSLKELKDIIT